MSYISDSFSQWNTIISYIPIITIIVITILVAIITYFWVKGIDKTKDSPVTDWDGKGLKDNLNKMEVKQ